jgi:hypothetical protein
MSSDITKVTRWQTRDGKLHPRESEAVGWARFLEAVDEANAMLAAGASVADVCRKAEIPVAAGSPLERITGETPLVVSHYQCCDAPGYRVQGIDADRKLLVYGNAGSRSGSYGAREPVGSVERYAAATLRALEG